MAVGKAGDTGGPQNINDYFNIQNPKDKQTSGNSSGGDQVPEEKKTMPKSSLVQGIAMRKASVKKAKVEARTATGVPASLDAYLGETSKAQVSQFSAENQQLLTKFVANLPADVDKKVITQQLESLISSMTTLGFAKGGVNAANIARMLPLMGLEMAADGMDKFIQMTDPLKTDSAKHNTLIGEFGKFFQVNNEVEAKAFGNSLINWYNGIVDHFYYKKAEEEHYSEMNQKANNAIAVATMDPKNEGKHAEMIKAEVYQSLGWKVGYFGYYTAPPFSGQAPKAGNDPAADKAMIQSNEAQVRLSVFFNNDYILRPERYNQSVQTVDTKGHAEGMKAADFFELKNIVAKEIPSLIAQQNPYYTTTAGTEGALAVPVARDVFANRVTNEAQLVALSTTTSLRDDYLKIADTIKPKAFGEAIKNLINAANIQDAKTDVEAFKNKNSFLHVLGNLSNDSNKKLHALIKKAIDSGEDAAQVFDQFKELVSGLGKMGVGKDNAIALIDGLSLEDASNAISKLGLMSFSNTSQLFEILANKDPIIRDKVLQGIDALYSSIAEDRSYIQSGSGGGLVGVGNTLTQDQKAELFKLASDSIKNPSDFLVLGDLANIIKGEEFSSKGIKAGIEKFNNSEDGKKIRDNAAILYSSGGTNAFKGIGSENFQKLITALAEGKTIEERVNLASSLKEFNEKQLGFFEKMLAPAKGDNWGLFHQLLGGMTVLGFGKGGVNESRDINIFGAAKMNSLGDVVNSLGHMSSIAPTDSQEAFNKNLGEFLTLSDPVLAKHGLEGLEMLYQRAADVSGAFKGGTQFETFAYNRDLLKEYAGQFLSLVKSPSDFLMIKGTLNSTYVASYSSSHFASTGQRLNEGAKGYIDRYGEIFEQMFAGQSVVAGDIADIKGIQPKVLADKLGLLVNNEIQLDVEKVFENITYLDAFVRNDMVVDSLRSYSQSVNNILAGLLPEITNGNRADVLSKLGLMMEALNKLGFENNEKADLSLLKHLDFDGAYTILSGINASFSNVAADNLNAVLAKDDKFYANQLVRVFQQVSDRSNEKPVGYFGFLPNKTFEAAQAFLSQMEKPYDILLLGAFIKGTQISGMGSVGYGSTSVNFAGDSATFMENNRGVVEELINIPLGPEEKSMLFDDLMSNRDMKDSVGWKLLGALGSIRNGMPVFSGADKEALWTSFSKDKTINTLKAFASTVEFLAMPDFDGKRSDLIANQSKTDTPIANMIKYGAIAFLQGQIAADLGAIKFNADELKPILEGAGSLVLQILKNNQSQDSSGLSTSDQTSVYDLSKVVNGVRNSVYGWVQAFSAADGSSSFSSKEIGILMDALSKDISNTGASKIEPLIYLLKNSALEGIRGDILTKYAGKETFFGDVVKEVFPHSIAAAVRDDIANNPNSILKGLEPDVQKVFVSRFALNAANDSIEYYTKYYDQLKTSFRPYVMGPDFNRDIGKVLDQIKADVALFSNAEGVIPFSAKDIDTLYKTLAKDNDLQKDQTRFAHIVKFLQKPGLDAVRSQIIADHANSKTPLESMFKAGMRHLLTDRTDGRELSEKDINSAIDVAWKAYSAGTAKDLLGAYDMGFNVFDRLNFKLNMETWEFEYTQEILTSVIGDQIPQYQGVDKVMGDQFFIADFMYELNSLDKKARKTVLNALQDAKIAFGEDWTSMHALAFLNKIVEVASGMYDPKLKSLKESGQMTANEIFSSFSSGAESTYALPIEERSTLVLNFLKKEKFSVTESKERTFMRLDTTTLGKTLDLGKMEFTEGFSVFLHGENRTFAPDTNFKAPVVQSEAEKDLNPLAGQESMPDAHWDDQVKIGEGKEYTGAYRIGAVLFGKDFAAKSIGGVIDYGNFSTQPEKDGSGKVIKNSSERQQKLTEFYALTDKLKGSDLRKFFEQVGKFELGNEQHLELLGKWNDPVAREKLMEEAKNKKQLDALKASYPGLSDILESAKEFSDSVAFNNALTAKLTSFTGETAKKDAGDYVKGLSSVMGGGFSKRLVAAGVSATTLLDLSPAEMTAFASIEEGRRFSIYKVLVKGHPLRDAFDTPMAEDVSGFKAFLAKLADPNSGYTADSVIYYEGFLYEMADTVMDLKISTNSVSTALNSESIAIYQKKLKDDFTTAMESLEGLKKVARGNSWTKTYMISMIDSYGDKIDTAYREGMKAAVNGLSEEQQSKLGILLQSFAYSDAGRNAFMVLMSANSGVFFNKLLDMPLDEQQSLVIGLVAGSEELQVFGLASSDRRDRLGGIDGGRRAASGRNMLENGLFTSGDKYYTNKGTDWHLADSLKKVGGYLTASFGKYMTSLSRITDLEIRTKVLKLMGDAPQVRGMQEFMDQLPSLKEAEANKLLDNLLSLNVGERRLFIDRMDTLNADNMPNNWNDAKLRAKVNPADTIKEFARFVQDYKEFAETSSTHRKVMWRAFVLLGQDLPHGWGNGASMGAMDEMSDYGEDYVTWDNNKKFYSDDNHAAHGKPAAYLGRLFSDYSKFMNHAHVKGASAEKVEEKVRQLMFNVPWWDEDWTSVSDNNIPDFGLWHIYDGNGHWRTRFFDERPEEWEKKANTWRP